MQNLGIGKSAAGLLVLVTLCGVALHFHGRRHRPDSVKPLGHQRIPPHERPPAAGRPQPPEALEAEPTRAETVAIDFDWRLVHLGSNTLPKLPREEVEKYLEQQRRSAASLLAAYHALDDTNYLAEAAANFPNDPQVQWTILARDAFPEERRKWLDLFKASSLENSLANYLSAENYFDGHYLHEPANEYRFGENRLSAREFLQSGQAQTAINELLEATRKPLFKDYTLDSRLDLEELNLSAGRTPAQARFASFGSDELLPELAKFKSIAIDLRELQKAYLSAGDTASAENLTGIGLALAARLRDGERARLIINQLVSSASEAILVSAWDANASYDFLNGQTPRQRLDEIKQQRGSIRFMADGARELIPNLTDAELLNYLDRSRLYGEVEAMRWLLQRKDAPATPP